MSGFAIKISIRNKAALIMIKRTKIVCTGPSTDKPGVLDAMILAGMNVARFIFSHGNHEDHAIRIAMVRVAAQKSQNQFPIRGVIYQGKINVR